jgi:hypothetical protein
MELSQRVKTAFNFHLWDYGAFQKEIPSYVSVAPELSFRLVQKVDPSSGSFRYLNSWHYCCESCKYRTDRQWETSEFKVYGSTKEIPNFVEEEIMQHTKDHQALGEWGISWYRSNSEKESNGGI